MLASSAYSRAKNVSEKQVAMRLNSFDILDAHAETYFYGFKFQHALLVSAKPSYVLICTKRKLESKCNLTKETVVSLVHGTFPYGERFVFHNIHIFLFSLDCAISAIVRTQNCIVKCPTPRMCFLASKRYRASLKNTLKGGKDIANRMVVEKVKTRQGSTRKIAGSISHCKGYII